MVGGHSQYDYGMESEDGEPRHNALATAPTAKPDFHDAAFDDDLFARDGFYMVHENSSNELPNTSAETTRPETAERQRKSQPTSTANDETSESGCTESTTRRTKKQAASQRKSSTIKRKKSSTKARGNAGPKPSKLEPKRTGSYVPPKKRSASFASRTTTPTTTTVNVPGSSTWGRVELEGAANDETDLLDRDYYYDWDASWLLQAATKKRSKKAMSAKKKASEPTVWDNYGFPADFSNSGDESSDPQLRKPWDGTSPGAPQGAPAAVCEPATEAGRPAENHERPFSFSPPPSANSDPRLAERSPAGTFNYGWLDCSEATPLPSTRKPPNSSHGDNYSYSYSSWWNQRESSRKGTRNGKVPSRPVSRAPSPAASVFYLEEERPLEVAVPLPDLVQRVPPPKALSPLPFPPTTSTTEAIAPPAPTGAAGERPSPSAWPTASPPGGAGVAGGEGRGAAAAFFPMPVAPTAKEVASPFHQTHLTPGTPKEVNATVAKPSRTDPVSASIADATAMALEVARTAQEKATTAEVVKEEEERMASNQLKESREGLRRQPLRFAPAYNKTNTGRTPRGVAGRASVDHSKFSAFLSPADASVATTSLGLPTTTAGSSYVDDPALEGTTDEDDEEEMDYDEVDETITGGYEEEEEEEEEEDEEEMSDEDGFDRVQERGRRGLVAARANAGRLTPQGRRGWSRGTPHHADVAAAVNARTPGGLGMCHVLGNAAVSPGGARAVARPPGHTPAVGAELASRQPIPPSSLPPSPGKVSPNEVRRIMRRDPLSLNERDLAVYVTHYHFDDVPFVPSPNWEGLKLSDKQERELSRKRGEAVPDTESSSESSETPSQEQPEAAPVPPSNGRTRRRSTPGGDLAVPPGAGMPSPAGHGANHFVATPAREVRGPSYPGDEHYIPAKAERGRSGRQAGRRARTTVKEMPMPTGGAVQTEAPSPTNRRAGRVMNGLR